jgi:hypothetical protein
LTFQVTVQFCPKNRVTPRESDCGDFNLELLVIYIKIKNKRRFEKNNMGSFNSPPKEVAILRDGRTGHEHQELPNNNFSLPESIIPIILH